MLSSNFEGKALEKSFFGGKAYDFIKKNCSIGAGSADT